ncbi:MAG: hypothetical protein KDC83_14920 [Flavobacteriales bacterium]|nr:hypothetical protein [Flavobacteriales bacterium]
MTITQLNFSDYYPFGMQKPGRKLNPGDYSFGFNGKENDNEIKGTGNWQNYGFRKYDPRLARFASIDPLASKYPELTPYQFASLTPIWAIDIDGLEAFFMHGTWGANKSFSPALKSKVASAFGNTATYTPGWSGINTDAARQEAAAQLVEFIKGHRNPGEAITIMGHSHGGNVAIIAAQILAQDEELNGTDINIITLNTPAREYRIDPDLQSRINHIHIYNQNEKAVVPKGGRGDYFVGGKSGKQVLGFIPSGEKGPAEHDFNDADVSIPYDDQYQGFGGFIRTGSIAAGVGHQGWRPGNFQNWMPKLKEASGGGNGAPSTPASSQPRGHGGSGMGQTHFQDMNSNDFE